MKEKYMKPLLVVERFEVKQSIAADCTVIESWDPEMINSSTIEYCGYELEKEWILWNNLIGTSSCTEWGEDYEAACYNNPAGLAQLFRS